MKFRTLCKQPVAARQMHNKSLFLAMRLIAVLIFAVCMQAAASGNAQTVSLSLRNAPVAEVFKAIEKQTGYTFIYFKEDIQKAGSINIEVTNVTLQDALDACFKGQPLTYTIDGKFVVIKIKEAGKIESTNPLPVDVKGRITNEKGEAVAGATVAVKGSKKLTSTNENGEFFLEGVGEDAVLVISHISFETQEIKINGKNEIAVQLKLNITELSTISINTGYQVLKPNEVTGSVTQPDMKMYDSRVSTDVLSKLEGITSGLVFNRSKTGVSSLNIRGRSTIFANTDPLIVVDNFPYDGDLNNINPNDIESVNLLKDAGAASIWGVRAGNGVIVITTKKGKFNQPLKVEVNTSITIGEKPDLFYDPNFLNSSDFADVETFLFNKGLYTSDFSATAKTPISPLVEMLNKRKLGQITPSDSAVFITALRNLDIRRQLTKYFYQKSINQQYSFSISGGNTKAAYLFSAGLDRNRSNLIRNKAERITLNSTNRFSPVKNLEFSVGLAYTQTTSENNNTVSDIFTGGKYSGIYPYAQLADESGKALPIIKNYRGLYADTAGSGKLLNWRNYPLDELANADNTNKLRDIRFSTSIRYTIIKGLSVDMNYVHENGIVEGRIFRSQSSYYTRNLINKYTVIKPDGSLKNNIPLGGILDLSNSKLISNRLRGQINYSTRVGKNNITAILGTEATEVKNNSDAFRTYGYEPLNVTYKPVNADSIYTTLPSGSGLVPSFGGFTSTLDRFRSFFGNISYSYNNRYSVSLSGRMDQSNLFGVSTNQKTVPLWSIGGRWDIDKENFYNISWLPSLKMRATYGYNGNLNRSLSAYTIASIVPGNGNQLNPGGPLFAIINSVGNPELRWEKIGMFNIGMDFELFKKRIISGSFEYFNKNGVDIIGDAPVPSSTGWNNARGNFSDMIGNGFDIRINSININKGFRWETTFLCSHAVDKVTKYKSSTAGSIVEGRPVSYISSLPWGGLDPNTGDPRGYLGDTLSKDYSNINKIIPADQVYNGPANPTLFGAILNMVNYKNISLSFNIIYKTGYYFARSSISYSNLFSSWNGHKDYALRWQNKGDELHTTIPSMIYPANSARDNFYTRSEVLVDKGGHVRLKDISLSYELNKDKVKKLPLAKIKIYLYANNLGIMWRANKHGIDPDYQNGYPAPRTFSFGLQAGF